MADDRRSLDDYDGLSRAEALRRLLALAEQDRTLYSPMTWWRRLKALWTLWRAT